MKSRILDDDAGAVTQQRVRDPKTEQAIYDKLAAIAPAVVDPFQRATATMDSGNYQDAIPSLAQTAVPNPGSMRMQARSVR